MKRLLPLLLALTLPNFAQQANHEQLIEALMQAPDEQSLNDAITAGKKAGLSEQIFLEARFILLVNQNDIPGLAALAPTFEAQLPNYSRDNTMIFGAKEDFESIVHYTKALGALQKDDTPLFKKHITEAYWLSPAHGTQFAPHIKAVRLKQAMSKVTLDLDRNFEDQKQSDKKTSLKEIAGESPVFLIHFWTPWIQPSLLAMPEFSAVAKVLTENKIPVVSFLLAGTADSRKEADNFIAENKDTQLGRWLIDPSTSSLASTLRIADLPTVVLANKEGRILFNGDPASITLWQKLAEINADIKPPTINPVLPEDLLEDPLTPQKEDE